VKLLADTHLLLWAAGEPNRLPAAARGLLADPGNAVHFSAASLWEIAIKLGRGRADFQVDLRALRRGLLLNGWRELPVSGEHAVELAALPPLHRDPFDRILVCQARVEGCVLLTADDELLAYGAPVRRV
jgi:PIN domain nuclease of toxin-antitoxin system